MGKYLIFSTLAILGIAAAIRWAVLPSPGGATLSRPLASQPAPAMEDPITAPGARTIQVPALMRNHLSAALAKLPPGTQIQYVRTGGEARPPLSLQDRLRSLGLSAVPTPGPIRIQEGRFAFVPDFYAVDENAFDASADYKVIGHSFGKVFVRAGESVSIPKGTLPVVMNTGNGALAMVTGVVVKPQPGAALESLGSDYGMALVQSFEGLNLAYFKSTRGSASELNSLLAALRKDERVQSADLTVFDRVVSTR